MWDLIVSVPDHCLSFYFYRHKIVGRPYVYENTAPVRFQTFSKHCAGLHGMPCDYSRAPEMPGCFM